MRATATARSVFRNAMRLAVDAVLPPLCPACSEPLTEDGAVCATCWSRLSFISRPYCERLGIPFAHDAGPGLLSPRAIAHPPAFGRARAAVRYDDVAGSLVHALKYADRLELAPMMGRWMAAAGRELIEAADALVPVPLHWRRLWARRFNQAAALADVMAKARGIPVVVDAMARVRPTSQQVGLSRAERANNGAVGVSRDGSRSVRHSRQAPDRRRRCDDDRRNGGELCADSDAGRGGQCGCDRVCLCLGCNGDMTPE